MTENIDPLDLHPVKGRIGGPPPPTPVKKTKPPNRTQAAKDLKMIEELREKSVSVVISDMLLTGRSVQETADELGVNTSVVRGHVSGLLAEYQESLAQHGEAVYTINHARLENLFHKSMQSAFPKDLAAKDLGDNHRRWAQLSLNLLKEQNRMAEMQINPNNKNNDDDDKGYVFEPTMKSHDNEFNIAQEIMSDSFMDKHGHRLGEKKSLGELQPSDLLVMQLKDGSEEESEQGDDLLTGDVSSMSDKFEELQSKLGEMDDDSTDQ